MALAQIREAYNGKWVLIEYKELDCNLEVVEGDAIAEAATEEDTHKRLPTVGPGKKTAIEYCGAWPTDTAVMFCLRPSRVDALVALRARIDVAARRIKLA